MIPYHHRKGHGRALTLIRKRLRFSQGEMGAMVGVHQAKVSQWEHDLMAVPSVLILAYGSLARRAGLDSIAKVLEAA